MHREWVDRRAEGSGRLHDWDPRLKVLLTLVTLLWISFGCTEPTEKSAARLVAIGAATIALAMRGGASSVCKFGYIKFMPHAST